MNLDDIRNEVAAIKASAGDPETAHGMEDDLHQNVLRAIADGTLDGDPTECAKEALRTLEERFPRWCA